MAAFAIGRLTVLAELGAGAGSRVFHVRRRADGGEYALKVVPAGRRADPRYPDQLKHEFRVARLLDHPNITRVYALEVRRDWLFRATAVRLLVEFAPGRALDRVPPLPVGCALRVFERVASALEHMHGRGVVHADIKPGNLLFDAACGVKLIDFGLARVEGDRAVRVRGTPQYMAPETLVQGAITPRTDLYNFGATMYHVLTGRSPLPPEPNTLPGARTRPPPVVAVGLLGPDVPAELTDLILRCTAPEPDRRPRGAGEVRRALTRLARTRPD
jgi:serine/threonine-protein kinase